MKSKIILAALCLALEQSASAAPPTCPCFPDDDLTGQVVQALGGRLIERCDLYPNTGQGRISGDITAWNESTGTVSHVVDHEVQQINPFIRFQLFCPLSSS